MRYGTIISLRLYPDHTVRITRAGIAPYTCQIAVRDTGTGSCQCNSCGPFIGVDHVDRGPIQIKRMRNPQAGDIISLSCC